MQLTEKDEQYYRPYAQRLARWTTEVFTSLPLLSLKALVSAKSNVHTEDKLPAM